MSTPLQVLLIEDNPDDAVLIGRHLQLGGFEPKIVRVETATDMITALNRQPWNVVVADYKLPEFNATDALRVLTAHGADLPFILVSGTIGEERAAAMIKAGAHDYVAKTNLQRLPLVIERELREVEGRRERKRLADETARLQAQERAAHQEIASIFARIGDGVVALDRDWNFTYVNERAGEILESRPEELLGKNLWDQFPETISQPFHDACDQALAQQSPVHAEEYFEGWDRWFEYHLYPAIHGLSIYFRDITERKRAEKELQQAYTFSNQVISSATEGIIVYDRELRYVIWNPFLERASGLREADVLGKHPWDLFPFIRELGIDQLLRRALAGETVNSPDISVSIPGSNKTIWTSAQYGPLRGEDDEIIGVIALVRDITERKAAEELLITREEQLRLFVEHSPAAIAMFDREMRYLVVSRRWMTDYRLGNQCILGRSHYEIFPEIPTRWKEIHQRCLAGATERCEEDPFPRADGGLDWVRWEVRPWQSRKGEIGGILIFSEVISDRKVAEAKLRDNEARLRLLTDQAPAILWTTDSNLVITSSAGSGLRGLNLKADQLNGTRLQDYLGTEDPTFLPLASHLDALHGKARSYEIGWKGRTFETHVEPMHDATGKLVGTIGIALDISDRRGAEMELREQQQAQKLFSEQLQALGMVVLELDASNTVDELCRRAVELGHARLALDRLSIWFLDKETRVMRGSFGIDEQGRLRDERHLRHGFPTGENEIQVLTRKTQAVVSNNWPLHDDIGREVGRGWHAVGGLWDGDKVIGLLFADNLIRQQPAPSHLREIIALFASSLGHLATRKRTEELLQRSTEQLRSLAARLQAVREEERIGIAREIHDELGQTLTGLKMDLDWMEGRLGRADSRAARKQLVDRVREMSKLIEDNIHTVQRISSELRPQVLDHIGLSAAMSWQAQEFQKRSGIQCSVTIEESGLAMLERELSTAIFRVFQEIMTNVARHSQATCVKVRLEQQNGSLIFEVTDNGRGITTEEVASSNSLGLIGIRERVMAFGGEVHFLGKHDKGTTVTLRVPIQRRNA